ncbi:MAG TPA: hypothetical protein VJI97_00160 [Candidatus Nanoarchaeia archaeon]|nr:hypothetical protein [Candidatus Nanoarchaeia archaeon]
MLKDKKSQSWSIDVALGFIIFMSAFFIAYTMINSNDDVKVDSLKKQSLTIIKQVTSEDSNLKVVDNNEISDQKLDELKDMDYEDLKRKLRADKDFCIYIEDENGNLVTMNNNYLGIGSPDIDLAGTPCSQR